MVSVAAIALFAACAWLAGRSRLLALAPILLIACAEVKKAGGYVGGTAGEWIACPLHLFSCGHVWLCEAPSSNPDNIYGRIEICVSDDDDIADVEAVYGACEPTPRHQGLCVWGCPPDAPGLAEGHGANAFDGEWGCE